MDALVDLIIGESTTLDVYVIVRLVVFVVVLELVSLICSYLGGMKK